MFKKFFNVIFVISGVIASFWRVFIKFRWHDEKLTSAPSNSTIEVKLFKIMVERKPSFGHHLLWSLPWSPHWHCFEAFGSWQHVYFIHCLPWWTFYETPQAHDFAFDHRLTYHRYDYFWPRALLQFLTASKGMIFDYEL